MMDEKSLLEAGEHNGAAHSAVVDVAKIPFRPEFRAACEMNSCGKYGRCWMCPPDVGPIGPMIELAKGYDKAFVFQTIGQLEDSFDIEGMEEAAVIHNKVAQALAGEVAPQLEGPLLMGAGACHVCERCASLDNEPCRFPDKAIASLESYGIAVSELAAICGLNYINGENTVTFFGAILYGHKTGDRKNGGADAET